MAADRPLRCALRTVGWAVLLATVVVALVAVVVSVARGPGERTAVEICRGWYARARSAAESSAVDQQVPGVSRAQPANPLTGGTRRVAGKLRPR